jgi:hypothetical protein
MIKFFIYGSLINALFMYTYNNNKKIFYTLNIISISYLLSYNIIYLL